MFDCWLSSEGHEQKCRITRHSSRRRVRKLLLDVPGPARLTSDVIRHPDLRRTHKVTEISFKETLIQKLLWQWVLPYISAVFTSYICINVLGGALVGYGAISTFTVKIESIIPCAILGICVGTMSYHKWYLSVLVGSAPPLLLLLFMLYGIFIGNNQVYLDQLHWTQIPIGMISSLFVFGLLGFAIRKAASSISNLTSNKIGK